MNLEFYVEKRPIHGLSSSFGNILIKAWHCSLSWFRFFFQRLWSHNRCLLNLAFETNVQKLKVPLEMLIYLFLESTWKYQIVSIDEENRVYTVPNTIWCTKEETMGNMKYIYICKVISKCYNVHSPCINWSDGCLANIKLENWFRYFQCFKNQSEAPMLIKEQIRVENCFQHIWMEPFYTNRSSGSINLGWRFSVETIAIAFNL